MRRVRAMLAAFITICGLLLGGIEAAAAGVQGMEILAEDTAVRKGQEITVTFALDGYTDIRDGVNALKGTLEFDPDVFEEAGSGCFIIRITDSLYLLRGRGAWKGKRYSVSV